MESAWYLARKQDPVDILKRLAVFGAKLPTDWGVLLGYADAVYVGDCGSKFLRTRPVGNFWVGPIQASSYFCEPEATCAGCGHRHGFTGKPKAKIRAKKR